MSRENASRRLPAATLPVNAWLNWCADEGLSPLRAALGIARTLPGVRYCVVGVDGLAQWREIADAWDVAAPRKAPSLSCDVSEVIDPRHWTVA